MSPTGWRVAAGRRIAATGWRSVATTSRLECFHANQHSAWRREVNDGKCDAVGRTGRRYSRPKRRRSENAGSLTQKRIKSCANLIP